MSKTKKQKKFVVKFKAFWSIVINIIVLIGGISFIYDRYDNVQSRKISALYNISSGNYGPVVSESLKYLAEKDCLIYKHFCFKSKSNLSGANIGSNQGKTYLDHYSFQNVNFKDTSFNNFTFKNITIQNSKLKNVTFTKSKIKNLYIVNSNYYGVFDKSSIENLSLNTTNKSGKYHISNPNTVTIEKTNINKLSSNGPNLNLTLEKTFINNLELTDTRLINLNIQDSHIDRAILSSSKIDRLNIYRSVINTSMMNSSYQREKHLDYYEVGYETSYPKFLEIALGRTIPRYHEKEFTNIKKTPEEVIREYIKKTPKENIREHIINSSKIIGNYIYNVFIPNTSANNVIIKNNTFILNPVHKKYSSALLMNYAIHGNNALFNKNNRLSNLKKNDLFSNNKLAYEKTPYPVVPLDKNSKMEILQKKLIYIDNSNKEYKEYVCMLFSFTKNKSRLEKGFNIKCE